MNWGMQTAENLFGFEFSQPESSISQAEENYVQKSDKFIVIAKVRQHLWRSPSYVGDCHVALLLAMTLFFGGSLGV